MKDQKSEPFKLFIEHHWFLKKAMWSSLQLAQGILSMKEWSHAIAIFY